MPGYPLALQHLPARIIAQLLIDVGIAVNPETTPIGAWPVVADFDIDVPDSVVSIYDTNPFQYFRSQITGEEVQEEGIQVRVRSSKPSTARAKILSIVHYFAHTLYNVDVTVTTAPSTTYRIQSIRKTSGPVLLSPRNRPASERAVMVSNHLITFVRIP